MGAVKRARLLPQLVLGRLHCLLFLWLLLICGAVLGSDQGGDPNVPLSRVADLGSCATPTTDVPPTRRIHLHCFFSYSVSDLTGTKWSSLVKGGTAEVFCRRSTHSLVFILRNYPPFKASPLKALAAAFRSMAGTDVMMMGVEPLPKHCECGGIEWPDRMGYAEDLDSEQRVVEVHVKTDAREMRRVWYDQTTCALPPLDAIHPGTHHHKAPVFNQFERLRKCFWRLVLQGKTTPVIRATRRLLLVDFEEDAFDPNETEAALVLDLPRGCIMNNIDQEVVVWVRQTEASQEAADGEVGLIRSEDDQKQLVTEVYVNVEPKEVGWTHWPHRRFKSALNFWMYYQLY